MREEINFKFQMGTDFCCTWYHSSGGTRQSITWCWIRYAIKCSLLSLKLEIAFGPEEKL